MTPPAIAFQDVWKAYPRWQAGSRTLKDLAYRRLPTVMRASDQRWVLRNIDFEVHAGESVGFIGHNGAGKSTLLRLGAGLGRPSRGRVRRSGTVRALLSLGENFDPTLSGRENAVTAALIAGMREREARRRLPEMLEFAQLESFAEAPIRTYSEGMKLRLAMAVAVQVPASVLLIDEVLAVGDLAFQERCLAHVRAQREDGTALLFASHDLDRIASECERAVWLSGGTVRLLGPAATVVAEYRQAMISETVSRTPLGDDLGDERLELGRTRFGTQEITIEDVRLGGPHGEIESGSDIAIAVRLRRQASAVGSCVFAVSINRRRDGVKCLDANTGNDGVAVDFGADGTDVQVVFQQPALAPGDYQVEVGAYQQDWEYAYDLHVGAYDLKVLGSRKHEGVLDSQRRWTVTA